MNFSLNILDFIHSGGMLYTANFFHIVTIPGAESYNTIKRLLISQDVLFQIAKNIANIAGK